MEFKKDQTFNKWRVVEDQTVFGKQKVLCQCSCGREFEVNVGNLKSGKSSGCYCCRNIFKRHGLCDKHRLYSTWKSMRTRCNNPNSKSYSYYGGRGITICKRWDDFLLFLEDMLPSFEEDKTLDRVDNDLGYYKENCKWSTHREQVNNQSTNLKIPYKGGFVTEAELALQTGLNRTTIQSRRRAGWPLERLGDELTRSKTSVS